MTRVVGLGAGGHAKVVLEILSFSSDHEVVGLLEPRRELWGEKVLGVPVLGNDDLLPDLYKQGVRHAFIGLGSTGNNGPRKRLYEKAKEIGFTIVSAVHPKAVVSPSARIAEGVTIMAHAVVNADAQLGEDIIVNTGAIVEHDCVIENHVHIATGARLASTVYVGESAHIGAGAAIRQCVRIGRRAIVGVGAAVVKDVPEEVVVVGVPARILKRIEVER